MHYEIKTQYTSPDLPLRQVEESHGSYKLVQVYPTNISSSFEATYNNEPKGVLKFEYDLVEGKVYSFGYESESFFIVIEDELVQVEEGSWDWIVPKGVDKLVRRYGEENREKTSIIASQKATITELIERIAELEDE